jgi:alpha-1,2-mannosyltransferase
MLLFERSKVLLFHVLRFVIALLSLLSDYCLYQSACKRLGNTVGSFFIVISIFSVGMFNASCAFLPSSFGMSMITFSISAYLQEKWLLSIFCTALAALLGWPFTAVLGFPIVFEMLVIRYKTLALKFIAYAALSGVAILLPMYLIDSFYYGKFTIVSRWLLILNALSF